MSHDPVPSNPSTGGTPAELPTPTQIVDVLSRTVEGQRDALLAIALAAYTYVLAVAKGSAQCFGRQHVLLLGPTGSGKTLIVKTLAEALRIPFYHASAAGLVEAGYVGTRIESILTGLRTAAGGKTPSAGIVFIDEIDKIAVVNGSERDISGRGVQNTLLTFLDGRVVQCPVENNGVAEVDTSRLLFVASGAFVGLDEIRRRRQGQQRVGFTQSLVDQEARVGSDDLVAFGMLPELIGRFSSIVELRPLDRASLVRILAETDGSVLVRQRAFFATHGIDLKVTRQALTALADRALARNVGARGLDQAVIECLRDTRARVWDLVAANVRQVVLTRGAVEGRERPREVRGVAAGHSEAAELRRTGLRAEALRASSSQESSSEQTWERYERLRSKLGWGSTIDAARRWWLLFEQENRSRLRLLLRVAEELLAREATINEFYFAWQDSSTQNIQGVLHYLDYKRLKAGEGRSHGKPEDESGAS